MGVVLFTLLGFELFWCLLVAASDLLGEFAFRIRLAPLSFFSGKGRRRRFLSRVPYLFNICRPVTFSPPSTRASFVQRCLFSLFSFLIYNFVFSESLLLLCFSKELRTFVPPCCRLAFEFILSSCCCVETRIQSLEVASQGKCAWSNVWQGSQWTFTRVQRVHGGTQWTDPRTVNRHLACRIKLSTTGSMY